MSNYYVPIQTEACEKSTSPSRESVTQWTSYGNAQEKITNYNVAIQTEACEKLTPPPRSPHILVRKFALTPTSYKWMEVGIIVGPVLSYVALVLGDNRGNKIVLPYRTWKSIIEKRMTIEALMQSKASPTLLIHELIVQLVKLREGNIIKLTLHDTYIYMKPTTVLFMLELEHCIEHVYIALYQSMNNATEKYKHLVTFLRKNCITNKDDAVNVLRKIYDKSSHIECELIAYASDNIIYDALHDK